MAKRLTAVIALALVTGLLAGCTVTARTGEIPAYGAFTMEKDIHWMADGTGTGFYRPMFTRGSGVSGLDNMPN